MKRPSFLLILASLFFLGQLQYLNAHEVARAGADGHSSASRDLRQR
jgi:hypothetical protein